MQSPNPQNLQKHFRRISNWINSRTLIPEREQSFFDKIPAFAGMTFLKI
jgi:hypothetical protein